MENPFRIIDARLRHIENMLHEIASNPPVIQAQATPPAQQIPQPQPTEGNRS